MVEGVFMIPLLATSVTSSVELQKNVALSSLKGMREGIKLKLQIFAMAMAVASMSFGVQSNHRRCILPVGFILFES